MLRNKQKPVMYHVRMAIAIEKDSIQRKKLILITSGVTIGLCLIFACFYFVRYADVGTAEDNRDAIKLGYGFKTTPEEALVYDQMCLELGQNYESGEYQDLVDNIASQIRSQDDVKLGTQWSTVYLFNGVLLMLILGNAILTMFGAYYFYPRLFALILNLFLTVIHFCAIVTTAVYRFRALGKLCALSIQPTKKEDDSWTY